MASIVLTESMLNQLEDTKNEIKKIHKILFCIMISLGCVLVYIVLDLYGELCMGY